MHKNIRYQISTTPRVTLGHVATSYAAASRGHIRTLFVNDAPDSHAVLRRYVDDVTAMLVENLGAYKDFTKTVDAKDAERLRVLLNLIIESREVVEDGKTLK